MGNLIIQQFVSADGFATDEDGQFTLFELVDGDSADFDRANTQWLDAIGGIVLGAGTYTMFSSYWPTSAAEGEVVAPQINAIPKHVFSRSLTEAPWGDHAPASIESGDAAEGIRRLKGEVDGDLIVWGSLTLTEAFFAAGEVDVVRLVVVPVAIHSGRGVFPAGKVRMSLRSTSVLGPLVELEYDVIR